MEVQNKEDYNGSSDDTEVPLTPLESGYISDSDSQPPSEEEEEEPCIDSDDDDTCTPCDQLDDTSMDIKKDIHVKEEEEKEIEEEEGDDTTTTTCCPLEQPQHTYEEPMMMPAVHPVKIPLKMRLLLFSDDDNKPVSAVDEAIIKGKEKKKMPKGWLPRVALETVSKRGKGGRETVAPVIVEEGASEMKKVAYKFRKPAMIKSSVSGGGGMKTKSIMQVKREQERALKAVLEQASFHL
jgi:hypothetical protein